MYVVQRGTYIGPAPSPSPLSLAAMRSCPRLLLPVSSRQRDDDGNAFKLLSMVRHLIFGFTQIKSRVRGAFTPPSLVLSMTRQHRRRVQVVVIVALALALALVLRFERGNSTTYTVVHLVPSFLSSSHRSLGLQVGWAALDDIVIACHSRRVSRVSLGPSLWCLRLGGCTTLRV